MKKLLFKTVFIGIAAMAALTSCDNDPTLQSYIVDSGDKDGFISTSIPKSILGIDASGFSADAQKAYNSVKKINVLVYPKNDKNAATFTKESEQLNNILSNDDYKLLMTHNQDGMKAKFLYEGDKDSIDEVIVFGTSDQMGMGVARIIGDDMNLSSLMKMMKELEKMDVNPAGMKNVLGGLGVDVNKNGEVDEEAIKDLLESNGIDTSEIEMNKE